jgi:hypothetical protein
MHFVQNMHCHLSDNDQPEIFACETTQRVGIGIDGRKSDSPDITFWFSTAHIIELERVLTFLWAMKDEQSAALVQEEKDQMAIAAEKQAA